MWKDGGLWVRGPIRALLLPKLRAHPHPCYDEQFSKIAYSPWDEETDIKWKQVPRLFPLFIHSREFCLLDFFQKVLTPLIIPARPSGADQVLLMKGLGLCVCSTLTWGSQQISLRMKDSLSVDLRDPCQHLPSGMDDEPFIAKISFLLFLLLGFQLGLASSPEFLAAAK